MNQTRGKSILNLFIRGLTLVSRFILIFSLGKFFPTEEVGMYGIFQTTINLSLFVLGLDFYTFANREVLGVPESERITVLRNQLLFYVFTYAIFLFPLLLIFTNGVLSTKYMLLFYLILIFEHLSQEFYRLYVMLSFPILANVLLFIRNGSWVFLIILSYWISGSKEYSLDVVFIGWAIGSGISVIIGFYKIIGMFGKFKPAKIEKAWFIRGLRTSGLFFISTISLIAIEHLNRYFINYWSGLSKVGVFTFYSQFANVINVIVFTLFAMVLYPKLIVAVNEKKPDVFYEIKSRLMKKVLISSTVAGLILSAAIWPVIILVKKQEYFTDIATFYLLIVSNICLNIALVYNYVLYAFKKDKLILYSTLIGGASSLILNMILIRYLSILGAAISLLTSYIFLILTKYYFAAGAEKEFTSEAERITNGTD